MQRSFQASFEQGGWEKNRSALVAGVGKDAVRYGSGKERANAGIGAETEAASKQWNNGTSVEI